jgi:hypothetical protein
VTQVLDLQGPLELSDDSVDNFVDRRRPTGRKARKIKHLAGLPAKTAARHREQNQ